MKLLVGLGDKTEHLLQTPKPFLLIDDGDIADVFEQQFPRARVFNPTEHSFNPLRGMDYKGARDFADIVFPDKDLMTYRNGKRALTRMLLKASRLDHLKGDKSDPPQAEALATVDDLLLSPVLRQVFCNPKNQFSFKGSVIARINRAELGDFDAFILGCLLIGQHKGHIILSDGGFYLRPLHMSLMRQKRLTVAVTTLARLPLTLQHELLTIPDKFGSGCTPADAETLAAFSGFREGQEGHSAFVEKMMAC